MTRFDGSYLTSDYLLVFPGFSHQQILVENRKFSRKKLYLTPSWRPSPQNFVTTPKFDKNKTTRWILITKGWPCFIVCNKTRLGFFYKNALYKFTVIINTCLLLQLIILFRFSGRTAEDQVMTKCIKFLTLEPIYKYSFFPATARMWNTLPPSLTHFHSLQFFKKASMFITNTDHRAWYSAYQGVHFIVRWRWRWYRYQLDGQMVAAALHCAR